MYLAGEGDRTTAYTMPGCICGRLPVGISQVIAILLHNAISYTPDQGRIELSLARHKERFAVSVQDNGIGISDADKKRINSSVTCPTPWVLF